MNVPELDNQLNALIIGGKSASRRRCSRTPRMEWQYDVDIAGMGPMTVVQVAVRQWKGGRVVRERFYHK